VAFHNAMHTHFTSTVQQTEFITYGRTSKSPIKESFITIQIHYMVVWWSKTNSDI